MNLKKLFLSFAIVGSLFSSIQARAGICEDAQLYTSAAFQYAYLASVYNLQYYRSMADHLSQLAAIRAGQCQQQESVYTEYGRPNPGSADGFYGGGN